MGFCGGVWFDLACGHGGGDNCVVVMVVVRLPFFGWVDFGLGFVVLAGGCVLVCVVFVGGWVSVCGGGASGWVSV